MSKPDQLRRFLFDKANIRGEIVQLNDVWQIMEANHKYHPVIREYLGEVVAAAVLLSATIKFEGSLTIQASGDGPLSLMVVECRSNFGVRGVAKYKEPLPEQTDIKTLLDKSNLIITIEQALTNERYQGIVALLEGNSIAEFLEGYLQHSEQLETRIFLAADKQAVGGCCCSNCRVKLKTMIAGIGSPTWAAPYRKKNYWNYRPQKLSTACITKKMCACLIPNRYIFSAVVPGKKSVICCALSAKEKLLVLLRNRTIFPWIVNSAAPPMILMKSILLKSMPAIILPRPVRPVTSSFNLSK